jgi:putative nucleotidyltransferase with HDIG domain
VSAPLDALRVALAGMPAYVVGGAVRDRLLGRETGDVDVVLEGDVRGAAQALRQATGGAAFPLSEAFGAWRVMAPRRDWQVDLQPLLAGDLAADLAARDFTVNAMAEPLAGGELIDPHGGREDLAARRLRMVGPDSLSADPLRAVRAVRLAAELGFAVEAGTLAAARESAPGLRGVAAERIFAELKRVVGSDDPVAAMTLLERAGVTAAVLPELLVMHDVAQNEFHHLDVHDHTLAVLGAAASLEADPAPIGAAAAERLASPLADDLNRWGGLRWAALLHDIAKPSTRGERADGRVTFLGHDAEGAEMAAGILRRLRASEKLCDYVAALTRHHLRLGFLVHERPLQARTIHRYLKTTAPWEADVTVLTVADRLATRGRNAETAIAAHLEVARTVLDAALAPPGEPLVRGDELMRELGLKPGPALGELLAQLEEARFVGEITTREEALVRARGLLGDTLRAP